MLITIYECSYMHIHDNNNKSFDVLCFNWEFVLSIMLAFLRVLNEINLKQNISMWLVYNTFYSIDKLLVLFYCLVLAYKLTYI